jgi:hypothetical protein
MLMVVVGAGSSSAAPFLIDVGERVRWDEKREFR